MLNLSCTADDGSSNKFRLLVVVIYLYRPNTIVVVFAAAAVFKLLLPRIFVLAVSAGLITTFSQLINHYYLPVPLLLFLCLLPLLHLLLLQVPQKGTLGFHHLGLMELLDFWDFLPNDRRGAAVKAPFVL